MLETALLIKLSLILLAAVVGGFLAFKYKQPVVIGYILAGLALGTVFPFFSGDYDLDIVTLIAEIGVALLLFTIGLEFSMSRLKKVGKPGILGSILQVVFTIVIFTLLLTVVFNFDIKISLFLGAVFSLSSTAVVAKILSEKNALETGHGDLTMAWLIVQDLAVIPMLLLLPIVTSSEAFNIVSIIFSITKAFLFIYLVLLLGRKTIPFLFKRLALYDNRELLLISAFLLCIFIATLAHIAGISFAIGAFLAGILVSSSAVNHKVFAEIRPLRDVFSSVFFVSLGFLISAQTLFANLLVSLSLALLVILVKILLVFLLILVFNYHSKIAFLTSFAIFQIGEFSFILAQVGYSSGVLSLQIYQVVISASIITLIITPFLFNNANYYYKWFKDFTYKYLPKIYNFIFVDLDSDAKMPRPRRVKMKDHIILIGYGRVGGYIGKILDLAGIPYVVVDMYYKTLYDLRKKGVISIYGDATNEDVLVAAGAEKARAAVIATPDIVTNELVLKNLRKVNPSLFVVARAHRIEDIASLSIRGVKHIVEPEYEAGIRIAENLLRHFDTQGKEIRKMLNEVRKNWRF